MTRYLVSRVAFAVLTIFAAVTVNFLLFRAAPGDPLARFRAIPGLDPDELHQLSELFSLDKSVWEQYVSYLGGLLTLDLGRSFQDGQPVWDTIVDAYARTLPMVLTAVMVAAVVGIVAGVVAARYRKRAADRVLTFSALTLYSLPAQWLGLMLIFAFSGVLPSGGRSDPFMIGADFWTRQIDVLEHMILPSLTLGLVLYGQYTVFTRSAMLETLGQDYILTAKAKGLRQRTVVWRHGFRNALLPIATLIGLSLNYVVAGSLLIETVFSWPGIGRATYDAVFARDWPMLQGIFLVLTASVVFINLVIDLLYMALDPRVERR
jgi:peptide/nickel transport system permease protein